MDDETTQWTREGDTHLRVPRAPTRPTTGRRSEGPRRGPARATGGMFYNPAMRFARDLSVLFIEERMHQRADRLREHREPDDRAVRPYRLLDALAATGARTIRIAKEATVPQELQLQGVTVDRDPRVHRLMVQNVAGNRVADKVAALLDDMHHVVGENHWDHVDVDPFGSPAPFLDAALRRLSGHGTIAVTATDTASLTGSAPNPCRRRYDARPFHGQGMHEAALRILAGAVVRQGARHERALTPVLAHATDHYVRVYLQSDTGARRIDEALDHLGFAVEEADGTRRVVPVEHGVPSDAAAWGGPLWGGPLHDKDLIDKLGQRLEAHPQLDERPLTRFFDRAGPESDAPPLYYEIGELARVARCGPPRLDVLLDALHAAGFQAARSHASDTGIKTDAPRPRLVALITDQEGKDGR